MILASVKIAPPGADDTDIPDHTTHELPHSLISDAASILAPSLQDESCQSALSWTANTAALRSHRCSHAA